MPIGSGLPSPATLLFNTAVRDLLSHMHREPIYINNDDIQYEALKALQSIYIKGSNTFKDSPSFPIGSIVVEQHDNDGPWTYRVIKEVNSDYNGRSYIQ